MLLETLNTISLLLDRIMEKQNKVNKRELEMLTLEIEIKLNKIRFKNNQINH